MLLTVQLQEQVALKWLDARDWMTLHEGCPSSSACCLRGLMTEEYDSISGAVMQCMLGQV